MEVCCYRVCCAIIQTLLYCAICTPCWAGVRNRELTLLKIITQTESKYLKQRASKDIGTVGNMLDWVVAWFVCFKNVVKVYAISQEKRRCSAIMR